MFPLQTFTSIYAHSNSDISPRGSVGIHRISEYAELPRNLWLGLPIVVRADSSLFTLVKPLGTLLYPPPGLIQQDHLLLIRLTLVRPLARLGILDFVSLLWLSGRIYQFL